jgi:hypothetical protein
MMALAIVFSFSPDGKYVAETSAGKVIVTHQPAAPTPMPAEKTAAAEHSGAAVHISPNAVGSELSHIATFGFEHALLDEGTGSRVDGFEAHRSDPGVNTPR